jgi:hypothetical protein
MKGLAARSRSRSLLTLAGGCALVVGALMPWLVVGYELPGPDRETVHKTYVQLGAEEAHGWVVIAAGALMIAFGLVMLGYARAGRTAMIATAAVTAAAAATLGDWSLRVADAGADLMMPGTIVAAVGVLLGVLAVLVGWPGSGRQRAALLGATIAAAAAIVLAASALVPGGSPVPVF